MERLALTTEIVHLRYDPPVPVLKKLLSQNDFCRVKIFSQKEQIAACTLGLLPGFHQLNLIELTRIIHHFFDQARLQTSDIDFSKQFFNMVKADSFASTMSNEALFQIECLLFIVLKKWRPELLKISGPVWQNALYSPQQELGSYANVRCLKFKISPHTDPFQLAQKIGQLRELNPGLLFRFDGNRQFELLDFFSFMDQLLGQVPGLLTAIDYIEEPFKSLNDLACAQRLSAFTFALDESFMPYYHSSNFSNLPGGPLVLKPSLLGISTTVALMKRFDDKRIIISSSFEDATIMEVLTFLAFFRNAEYHGLTPGNILV